MHTLRILTTLTVLIVLSFSNTALALSINDVRIGIHPDKTRLVFDLDQVADFRIFTLSNPYRIVIDMPTLSWQTHAIQSNAQAGISAVRHGALKTDISRIVIDMTTPVIVKSAFVLPATADKSNRLVIDYQLTNAANFQKNTNQVYGTLDASNPIHTASTPPQETTTPPQTTYTKPVIVIDPGHGGNDPGAIGPNNLYEKNVVLALGKALKAELEATGRYTVYMTRSTDHYIKLSNRVKFAREKGADLFISLHADSIQKPDVHGASIYTLSEKASDAQTAKLAARENQSDIIAGIDLSVEDQDVAGILVDLAMRDTMNQSKFFAARIVESYERDNMRMLENAHRHAGFAVLKAPDIPSVLVEAGFMSNKNEAKKLNTPAQRKKIAQTLKTGIDRYFEQVRKNQRI